MGGKCVDSIFGLETVESWRKQIETQTGKKCIPVWHKQRGVDYWKQMCRDYDYIAIGGLVLGAKKLYQESGGKLVLKDIAAQLNVSEGTVRSWKNRYQWNRKDNATLQSKQKKDCNVAKKRGAKKGNQNAKGYGAPKGNKNHLKHGIYEKMLFEFLSQEEQELFLQQEFDEVEECKKMIRFCDLQILKFMRKIKELEEESGGLVVSGVSKKKTTTKGIERDAASDFTEEETATNTVAVHELILKYNNEIEKAKKQKMKCLEILSKFVNNEQKEPAESKINIYLPSNDRG